MESPELKFFESAALAKGEALFVCHAGDPRLPADLRGGVEMPCVVAGDLALLSETLTVSRVAELWEEAAPYRGRRDGGSMRAPLALSIPPAPARRL
jgi:hypothetical protein